MTGLFIGYLGRIRASNWLYNVQLQYNCGICHTHTHKSCFFKLLLCQLTSWEFGAGYIPIYIIPDVLSPSISYAQNCVGISLGHFWGVPSTPMLIITRTAPSFKVCLQCGHQSDLSFVMTLPLLSNSMASLIEPHS